MKKLFKFGCLSIALLLAGVLVFAFVTAIIETASNSTTGTSTNSKLAKELNVSEDEVNGIIDIFNDVGIANYTSITHDELLDNAHFEGEKGYRINTKEVSNVILYMNNDNSVNIIKYADETLYKNNGLVAKLGDFILTNDEKSELQYKCQEAIKSVLKAPSTAKFPNILDWKFGKKNGVTIVQSYVDSQNSFGAMVRSEFQFKFQNGEVVSLIFDGKEYIK